MRLQEWRLILGHIFSLIIIVAVVNDIGENYWKKQLDAVLLSQPKHINKVESDKPLTA